MEKEKEGRFAGLWNRRSLSFKMEKTANRKKKSHWNREGTENRSQKLLEAVLIVALFYRAAIGMLQDIGVKNQTWVPYVVCIVLALGITWAQAYVKKWILALGILLVQGIWGWMAYKTFDLWITEADKIINRICIFIDHYYQTQLSWEKSYSAELSGVMWAFLPMVFLGIELLAVLWDRPGIHGLLPSLFLMGLLLVGETPSLSNLFFLALGFLLSTRRQNHIPVVVLGAVLSLVIALLGFRAPARDLAAKMPEMLAIQREVEAKCENLLWRLRYGDGKLPDGLVTDQYPRYDNVDVITVTVDQKPENPIYLANFYGDRFVAGKWEDTKEEKGKRREEATRNFQKYRDYYGFQGKINCVLEGQEIQPEDPPVIFNGNYEGLSLGDGASPSENGVKIAYYDNDYEELVVYGPDLWQEDEANRAFIYDTYTRVPGDMQVIQDMAENLQVSLRTLQSGIYSGGFGSSGVEALVVARYLQTYFNLEYTYSKEMDTPEGEDIMTYFLQTSHRGYCVHYATAGTLLLRQLGIPARYVSGYVVTQNGYFPTEDGYTKTIKDTQAHAWTEVYVDHLGWVPVDMTPGYATHTQLVGDEQETETQTQETPETEIQNSEEKDTEAETETPVETETRMDTGNGEKEQTVNEAGGTPDEYPGPLKRLWTFLVYIWPVVWPILVAVAAVMSVIYGIKAIRRYRRIRIERLVHAQKYRRAVTAINHEIYRKLKRSVPASWNYMTDEEYLRLLKGAFREYDWEVYMGVVRKAVYSRNELTKEEYEAVRDIAARVDKEPQISYHKWM